MNDCENDGRDYSENIDEGPLSEETQGIFSSSKPEAKDTKKQDVGKPEKSAEKSPIRGTDRCYCKTGKGPRARRQKGMKKEKKGIKKGKGMKRGKGVRGSKEHPEKKGKRGRKKKERRLVNPFIIFYLEMYYKNPKQCVTDVAVEAGKAWCSMSPKQKEEYIHKAKNRSVQILKKARKKSKGCS